MSDNTGPFQVPGSGPEGDHTVVMMSCDCREWPIVLGNRIGRCGYCGVSPRWPKAGVT